MLRLITAALVAVFSIPASAQGLCGNRDNIVGQLAERHHETTAAMGLTTNGRIVEVLKSEDGTWTIIVSSPDGRSCLMAFGDHWETVQPAATDPGA